MGKIGKFVGIFCVGSVSLVSDFSNVLVNYDNVADIAENIIGKMLTEIFPNESDSKVLVNPDNIVSEIGDSENIDNQKVANSKSEIISAKKPKEDKVNKKSNDICNVEIYSNLPVECLFKD